MDTNLIPHLFKTEYGKLVAVLTKSFGLEHIELAEDIASDTFMTALNTWPYRGTPENPTAWLYIVAKNRLKNHLTRSRNYTARILTEIDATGDHSKPIEPDFSDENISDSQLQMLFAVCHPSISAEAQICLALRILGGLGLEEIADALLSTKEAVHKRLQRAKETLHAADIQLEMPADGLIPERLDTVLQTIYLLFSEGYYSESNKAIVRPELCVEALNLTYLLLRNPSTNTHATNALMALMCFHSSRLKARQASPGEVVLYDEQDRSLWDPQFIEKGFYYLQQASKWDAVSPYYIEASIAYWHTVDNSHPGKWSSILKLYDVLVLTQDSPAVALNRLWAVSKVCGNWAAIEQAKKLNDTSGHFYFMLLAELYRPLDSGERRAYLVKALELCKSEGGRKRLRQQIAEVDC